MPTRYTARWIFPATAPPIANGVLVVEGERIVALEPPGAADVDFGNAAILPGFVNAHTHLDLGGARDLMPPDAAQPFTEWIKQVIAFRRGRSLEMVQSDIAAGIRESLACGTTTVGDIAAAGQSWPLLAASPLRSTVYWELIGLTPERFGESVARFEELRQPPTPHCQWGVSPHAPYTANAALSQELLGRAPLSAIHLAESLEERELLQHRRGPFVEFLNSVGAYHEPGLARSWAEYLAATGGRSLLVHANYLPANTAFAPGQVPVVCPRTHAAFGHARHPFPQWLARGVPVAIGTDSLASNPDLDIFAEAVFLRKNYAELPDADLLKMLTIHGAFGLGWDHEIGSLEPHKSADCVILALENRDSQNPFEMLWTSDATPRRVMIRGVMRGSGDGPICSAGARESFSRGTL